MQGQQERHGGERRRRRRHDTAHVHHHVRRIRPVPLLLLPPSHTHAPELPRQHPVGRLPQRAQDGQGVVRLEVLADEAWDGLLLLLPLLLAAPRVPPPLWRSGGVRREERREGVPLNS